MSNDLISVIVPVYNVEKYVGHTLESLIKQTYKNIEILVVDDGSTDASPSICDKFLYDDRVKVYHRKNSGLSASRQFGIDICNGVYFATVDSDDYVAENFIECLYNSIMQNNADIAVCGIKCFTDGKNDFVDALPKYQGEKIAFTKELIYSDFHKIAGELTLSDSWNKLYKTEFVKRTCVRFELNNKYNGTDLQFNHRLALHCPVYSVVNEALLYHRNLPGSRVHRKNKPLQDGFETITLSLINECINLGLLPVNELSKVYYSFINMVVLDVYYYGGTINEKHKRFKDIVSQNRLFLEENSEYICRYKNEKALSLFSLNMTAVVLGRVIFLDIMSLMFNVLRSIKNMLRK